MPQALGQLDIALLSQRILDFSKAVDGDGTGRLPDSLK